MSQFCVKLRYSERNYTKEAAHFSANSREVHRSSSASYFTDFKFNYLSTFFINYKNIILILLCTKRVYTAFCIKHKYSDK